MKKLVCMECCKEWYTANTNGKKENFICDDCEGMLEEIEFKVDKSECLKEVINRK